MDATITITKQNATEAEVDTVRALATARGWTVEWNMHGVG